MKISRKICQKYHALKRLRERYGIVEDQVFLGELVGKIKNNEAFFLKRQSCRITLFRVYHKDKEFYIIYDSKRKSIVTFLTKAMVEERLGNVENFIDSKKSCSNTSRVEEYIKLLQSSKV